MSVVLLDCDGVLSSFTEHLMATLSSMNLVVPEVFHEYEIFNAMTPATKAAAYEVLQEGLFWSRIPPDPHAEKAVRAIRGDCHEIYVATSPWLSCRDWDSRRRSWLKEYFGIKPDHVICAGSKTMVFGDVFVDDKPSNVREWSKQWPTCSAYLMDRPWNKKEDDLERIGWTDQGIMKLLRGLS